jgi:hypothetical protein
MRDDEVERSDATDCVGIRLEGQTDAAKHLDDGIRCLGASSEVTA